MLIWDKKYRNFGNNWSGNRNNYIDNILITACIWSTFRVSDFFFKIYQLG